MTTGGGLRDILAGAAHAVARLPRVIRAVPRGWRIVHEERWISWRGLKRLYTAAHDDQRLSWEGHYLICAGASALTGLVWQLARGGFAPGYFVAASILLVVFLVREMGDEAKWRRLGLWDALDKDTSLQGAAREGVTRRYDKIGDLSGPIDNWGTAGLFMLDWSLT